MPEPSSWPEDGEEFPPPELILGSSGPAGPGGIQPPGRFAAGLARQHGWRLVAARFIAFAAMLGILLVVLAEFVRY